MEQNSISNSIKTKDVIVRLIVVLLACSFWIVYRLFYMTENKKAWDYKYCFDDKLLTGLEANISAYISQNWYIRNLLMITGSNLLDVFFCSFLIMFVKKGKSWTPIIHFALFYGIRNSLVQT